MPNPTQLWMPFNAEAAESPALPPATRQELRELLARLLLQFVGPLATTENEEACDEDR